MTLTKADYLLGAMYRVGWRKNCTRDQLVSMMTSFDTGLNETKAKQLAEHWLCSYAAARRGGWQAA